MPRVIRLTKIGPSLSLLLLLPLIAPLRGGKPAGEFAAEISKLLSSGKLAQADALVERHLSQQPPSSEAFLEVGRLYFEHDQWQRAATFLRKSLELQNQNDVAHLMLGLSLAELQRPEESEKELQIAVQQNPSSDINWYFAGWRLLLRGKYEASLPYFYKAVALNPKNPNAHRALASALARTGSYGLAEDYYKKAIQLIEQTQEQNPEPYLDLAYVLLFSNQNEPAARALECIRKAMAINPKMAEAYYLSGKALFKLDRYSEARGELVKASELNPKDARPHFLLAQVYDRLGQVQQAKVSRQTFSKLTQKRTDESPGMSNTRP
jgi:tetratricopeptide (TPR) repeat protein